MEIKVLGTGCKKCNQLYETAVRAVSQSGVEATVQKVEDIDSILAHGVMMTPGLVIGDEVKSTGRVPEVSQIVSWITTEAGRP